MKYLCLIYYDEKALDELTPEQKEALIGEARAFDQELAASGYLIAAKALEPTGAAVTVRTWNGRLSATDGPFAETKEQLGGFVLIEARDLNEAIQVAARIPPGRLGCVEVRPIRNFER